MEKDTKLSPEAHAMLFEEGIQWVPWMDDGTMHGHDHAVFAPHMLVNNPMEPQVTELLEAGEANGKKGIIVRMKLKDGTVARVMITREEDPFDKASQS